MIDCWNPQEGDVAVPRRKAGYHAVVVASDDDTVLFFQVVDGKPSDRITNRLSTFIDRFELLYRPEEVAAS